MLKLPRKEERKNERKKGGKKGKERKRGRKARGKNEGEKCKRIEWLVYWERRRNCVKNNEGTWLAIRKKIFS